MRIAREFLLAVLFLSFVSVAQDRPDSKRQKRESERKRGGAGVWVPNPDPTTRVPDPPTEFVSPQRVRSGQRTEDLRQLFAGIQEALLSGNINLVASHLGSHVMLNLRDGENGLFSSKQAYYVLENYLQSRRILHLDLTPSDDLESNPYATGSAGVNFKGSKDVMQVYVAVTKTGDRWVITQITFS